MRNDLWPFVRDFSKELREENAAIFAGAGLSKASGVVDWPSLLKEIAEDLGLDVKREHDLVRLAQFHVNKRARSRDKIHRTLLESFSEGLKPNKNHERLAALPIPTYWTTNYDTLIEDALKAAGKVVDVKHDVKQLTQTKPRRDVTVYKMHGDISVPSDAVLTREDYERYHKTRKEFLRALSGDLVSRTFLFIGCSFSDPNLDYVLARISAEWTVSQRQHYFLTRKPRKGGTESDADFAYRKLKEELFADDLRRFALEPVWLEDYDEIPVILDELRKIYRRDTVFVSGAAHEYAPPWNEDEALAFAKSLAMKLVDADFKLVSGFGLGVGSAVIAGALEQVLFHRKQPLRDQLVTRPFPQTVRDQLVTRQGGSGDVAKLRALWTEYRGQMISQAGIAIFLFGNKVDKETGKVVLSDGMREEFDIAKREGLLLVPIGATGSMADELWTEVNSSFDAHFVGADKALRDAFEALNDKLLPKDQLLAKTMDFIKLIRRT